MSTVAQKNDIKNSFEKIQILNDKVCLLLQHQTDYFLWLDYRAEPRLSIVNPIERLEYVLKLVTLHPEQKAKTVLFCPGFIAATPSLYDAITELNAAKREFQHKMVTLRKDLLKIQEATLDNQFGNPSHERPQIVHQFLIDINLEHLHFKHVYRCFPTIDFTPKQLGWTWAHTQSIKTITPEQAIYLLEKRNNDEGRYDEEIAKVKALDPEQRLSIRQKLAPHLRVNVVDQNNKRSMLKGTLPVVFLKGQELPLIRPAKQRLEGTPNRLSRRDKKSSDVPFIPAIRAYLSKTIDEAAENYQDSSEHQEENS